MRQRQWHQQLTGGTALDIALAHARLALLAEDARDWHLLRVAANAEELTALVTAPKTRKRAKLKVTEAAASFLDVEQKVRVCQREGFVGRRRVLQQGLRILRSAVDEECYAAGLLFYGMGGLGKSSTAARLCERLQDSHMPWVFFGVLDVDSLRAMFAEKLGSSEVNALLSDESTPLQRRLAMVLESLETPVLFVFDDFEQNAQPILGHSTVGRFVPQTRETDGALILQSSAELVVQALLAAITEVDSDCRVIVTCRQQVDLPLQSIQLDSLRNAELDKKLRALSAFAEHSKIDKDLQERAKALATGNPRLLEWLNKVLADQSVEMEIVLQRLEAETDRFRHEDLLLESLLEQLQEPLPRILAGLSVFVLPVPLTALKAVLAEIGVEVVDLRRLQGLGLIERSKSSVFVSEVLQPLLVEKLTAVEWHLATRAASQALHHLWRKQWEGQNFNEVQALEIRRLAQAAEQREIAFVVTWKVAANAVNHSRYREALHWCQETLQLGDDYRIQHQLARAEQMLGLSSCIEHYEQALATALSLRETRSENLIELAAIQNNLAAFVAQQGDVSRALGLWKDSLAIKESIGNFHGKATTLYNMAEVIAQQHDIPQALQLLHESLAIYEQLNDTRCKATTLNEMSRILAEQGDWRQALERWNEALVYLEEIGDVYGKITVQCNMAVVFMLQGKISKALEIWHEALALIEKIGNAQGKAAILHNIAEAIAQHGDVSEALKLYDEALNLEQHTGNLKGQAETLESIASLLAEQGDVQQAMHLWERALAACEKIGHVKMQAVILDSMVNAAYAQNDSATAEALSLQAIVLLSQMQESTGLLKFLIDLSALPNQQHARSYAAQACWLGLRVDVSAAMRLSLCQRLLEKSGGVEAEHAILISAAAVMSISRSDGEHPDFEDLQQEAFEILTDCLQARNIAPDNIQQYLNQNQLINPEYLLPKLDQLIDTWVTKWVFDREFVL